MRGSRLLLVLALCAFVVTTVLVAQGCSKPSTDTATTAAGPAKTPPAAKPKPEEKKASTESAAGKTETADLKVGTTLENLQAAFSGESSANLKYLAFARKADEEGYKQVAVLFRAAARSEEIHASNHKAAIAKLGGEAKADITPADVKTTKENLEAAIKGETYENETMYPAFIKVAQTDKNADAIKTLNGAMKVEAEHAKLYKEALGNLDGWKTVTAEFSVCPVCGFTTMKLDFPKCPVCSTEASKFEKIK
jgi:rubrerythrin